LVLRDDPDDHKDDIKPIGEAMKDVITMDNLTPLTDDDSSLVDGGVITCTEFVVGMSTIGGAAVGFGLMGPPFGVFVGGTIGGGLGTILARKVCSV
jgi:hypothetical protein